LKELVVFVLSLALIHLFQGVGGSKREKERERERERVCV